MVHRSPVESPFFEEAPISRRFPSSISRQNSNGDSNNGYFQEEEYIFYRPPNKDYFEGPFTERLCQFWYKEGFFYNGLEFRFGTDGEIETLESLKARNGRECPFQEGVNKLPPKLSSNELLLKTLHGRVIDLAEDLAKLKEEKEERDALHISHKIELDSLTNRVKELMEKSVRSEQYMHDTDLQFTSINEQIVDMKESLSFAPVVNTAEEEATEEVIPLCEIAVESVSEITPLPLTICDDIAEVRSELDRLNDKTDSLDKFTAKLSRKVDKMKCLMNTVDIIGDGLTKKHGVYDRIDYLETSVDVIHQVIGGERIELSEMRNEDVVIPMDISPNGGLMEDISPNGGPVPDVWYTPNERLVDLSLHFPPFDAASQSIAPVTTATWSIPEQFIGIPKDHIENWESIGDIPDAPWKDNGAEELTENAPLSTKEDAMDKEKIGHVGDKEDLAMKMDPGIGQLEHMGKGLGLLLQRPEKDIAIAADEDIDRLVAAIKGAKMLHIAESLKHYFREALVCEVCSTVEKKAEIHNAIEYFEHLNRAHFKKCGGAEKVLVNQFAFLLELFKAPVPVPMYLAKRQYAEREKNKPWLKREGTSSPNVKAIGKKKK